MDEKKLAGPPLALPQGRSRIEGTLLTKKVVKRLKPKSAFLKNLERMQRPKKVKNETRKGRDRGEAPPAQMGAIPLSVVPGRRS